MDPLFFHDENYYFSCFPSITGSTSSKYTPVPPAVQPYEWCAKHAKRRSMACLEKVEDPDIYCCRSRDECKTSTQKDGSRDTRECHKHKKRRLLQHLVHDIDDTGASVYVCQHPNECKNSVPLVPGRYGQDDMWAWNYLPWMWPMLGQSDMQYSGMAVPDMAAGMPGVATSQQFQQMMPMMQPDLAAGLSLPNITAPTFPTTSAPFLFTPPATGDTTAPPPFVDPQAWSQPPPIPPPQQPVPQPAAQPADAPEGTKEKKKRKKNKDTHAESTSPVPPERGQDLEPKKKRKKKVKKKKKKEEAKAETAAVKVGDKEVMVVHGRRVPAKLLSEWPKDSSRDATRGGPLPLLPSPPTGHRKSIMVRIVQKVYPLGDTGRGRKATRRGVSKEPKAKRSRQ